MSRYYCKCCNYDAKVKGNYLKHLNTNKHQKIKQIQYNTQVHGENINYHDSKHQFPITNICKYCDKNFTTKQAMYRHIKYTCSQNSDEYIIELCRLLNEKDRILMEQGNQIKVLYDKIERLSNKLRITNINNGIINNNVNIELLNFEQTDYSHLTENDYVTCIRDCNYSVKTLIEKVHFNEKKPENMNIYISSIKGKYAMVYKNNKWQIMDRKTQIDDLYDTNEIILSSWYKEYKVKYPEIMQDMKRYLQNIEENDTINEVKKEILLMLYNNRNQIMTVT